MMGDLDWFSQTFPFPEGDITWNKRAALAMVRAGLAVVAVTPGDKVPRCWYHLDARAKKAADVAAQEAGTAKADGTHQCGEHCVITDEKQLSRVGIKKLLDSGANLAVSPRYCAKRVILVDVDTDAERRAFLADWNERGEAIDQNTPLTVTSPGVHDTKADVWRHKDGGHVWFTVPDGIELPKSPGKLKWCRCHGFSAPADCPNTWAAYWNAGYVLVPPSIRKEGPYQVTGEAHEAPAWLLELIHEAGERRIAPTGELNNDGNDSINTWAAATPWSDLLTAAAWTEWGTESCGCSTWTRPGHANPKTGTAHDPGCGQMSTDGGHGFLHLWTDAWRPSGKANLTKLDFVAHNWHGGDTRAAMDALGIARGRRDEDPALDELFVLGESLGKGSAPESAGALPEQKEDTTAPDLAAFWDSREVLRNIRDYAIAEYVSPWAMLGSVLAYVTALTPPRVTVKAITTGSLNLFVGLVGKPGSGKDVAREAARSWFGEVADDAHLYQREIGTGQGLVAAYVRRFSDRETKEQVIQQVRESVLVTVSEIDQITAHAKQQASTLVPTLRSAWMGQLLGGLYKDTAKDLSVGAHTYRLCLVVGIQPDHARNLVGDAGGGLPQRFIWMPATDPTLPDLADDEDPEYPEPWGWKPPVRCRDLNDPFTLGEEHHPEPDVVMDVCDKARREFRRERHARAKGTWTGDDLDTHSLFGRLKVAAALALLDQRTEVTEADWDLADTVMTVSKHVRGRVLRRLEDEDRKQRDAERQAQAEAAVAVEKAKAESALEQAKAKVRSVLARQTAGEWIPASKVRKSITASARPVFEDAVSELVDAGIAEREDREKGHVLRLRQG